MALLLPLPAAAQTFVGLDLVADGESRWFDNFSDVFAQADGGIFSGGPNGSDGFFDSTQLPSIVPIGGGTPILVFPFGVNFGNVGKVFVDTSGVTGTGVESAPITDLEIEFNDFIADDDAINDEPYTTTFSNITGNVTFVDGEADDITLNSDVLFRYAAPEGTFDFTGSFDVAEGDFTLFCSCPETYVINPIFPNPLGFTWDVTGVATPVPEPGLPIALAAALSVMGVGARVRARRI